MPSIKFDTTLMRLIKDMQEVRAALRHVTTNLPLYDVANENTPASISTDQNDYVPGNYDVLRIDATANVSITGISGGKKGRFLEIINVGTGRISFPDESASSIAANRIATPYDQTVTLLPNARVRFYYDNTQERWTVSDLPNIQGEFGKLAYISNSVQKIVTVAKEVFTPIIPDTIVSDTWGYWNPSTGRFVIPNGESGLYLLVLSLYWSSAVSEVWYGDILVVSATKTYALLYWPSDSQTYHPEHAAVVAYLTPGEYLEVQGYQTSVFTTSRDINTNAVGSPVFTFCKIG